MKKIKLAAAVITALVTLGVTAAPALASPGKGAALSSATYNCGPDGTVVITTPPANRDEPAGFIGGGVYLAQSITVSGFGTQTTKTYGIPTLGRPTVSCTGAFGPITVQVVAVAVA